MSGVGLFYILLEVLWTMLLFLLIIKNIRIRASYAVRIRGLVLMTLQVLALHVYVSAIFIVYPLNGSYTCAAEFWMMNIIFPGALALFQASTVKLLAVHENQLALFHASSATDLHATVDRVKLPYLPWLTVKARNLKLAHHYKWISIGFAFQVLHSPTPILYRCCSNKTLDRSRSPFFSSSAPTSSECRLHSSAMPQIRLSAAAVGNGMKDSSL